MDEWAAVELFISLSQREQEIEKVRECLAYQKEFEPYAVFSRLLSHRDEVVRAENFLDFLR